MTTHRRKIITIALVLSALFLLLAALGQHWPSWGQDEGTYTDQATAVLNGRLTWYTYWYDHPPLGWMLLAPFMWFFSLFGMENIAAARMVSALAIAVSAMLAYGIAWRVTARRYLSLIAPAMLLTGMITWSVQRMVYLDTYATPLLLASIFLFLDPKRRMWHYAIAGALFALSVLCKETFLLFLPGVLYLAWQRLSEFDPERRRILRPFAFAASLTTVTLIVGSYPVFALMRGEFFPGEGHVSLWDAIMFQLVSRSGSGTVWTPGSGKQELWLGWIEADPILMWSLAASVLLLAVRRWRWLPMMIVGFSLPALVGSGYTPVMHVIALLPLASLVWAAYADTGWTLMERLHVKPVRVGYALVIAAVAAVVLPVRATAVVSDIDLNANKEVNEALQWIDDNIDPEANIMSDGATISQIYEMGYIIDVNDIDAGTTPTHHVLAHETLDLDPEVASKFHNGCDINYVIMTTQISTDIESLNLKNLTDVLTRTTSIWQNDIIDVRKVVTPCQ